MLAILSTFFGIFSSVIPNLLRMWERRQEFKYELELTKIRIEAMAAGLQHSLDMEDSRNLVREGISVRGHDMSLSSNSTVEALRASVRPVITYAFFGLFCIIKLAVVYVMLKSGETPMDLINAIWGGEELALFGAILGFWFGSRIITKMEELNFRKMSFKK